MQGKVHNLTIVAFLGVMNSTFPCVGGIVWASQIQPARKMRLSLSAEDAFGYYTGRTPGSVIRTLDFERVNREESQVPHLGRHSDRRVLRVLGVEGPIWKTCGRGSEEPRKGPSC